MEEKTLMNQRLLTWTTKRVELPMAKTEKTAVEADWGEQSRGSIWNYRFVKIGSNIKSIDLSLLIQDMITQ